VLSGSRTHDHELKVLSSATVNYLVAVGTILLLEVAPDGTLEYRDRFRRAAECEPAAMMRGLFSDPDAATLIEKDRPVRFVCRKILVDPTGREGSSP
jgi:hypothetical protein